MKRSQLFFAIQLLVVSTLIHCSGKDEPTQLGREEQFDLSGVISGTASEGVTISAHDKTSLSSSDGTYTIPGLVPGNYMVTPSKEGHYFLPESREVVIEDQEVENVDFQVFADDEVLYNEASWRLFNPEVYSIRKNQSALLQLDLTENALWFNEDQGGLIYQEITGDFIVEGRVTARRRTDDTEEVTCSICLGGFMARDPDGSSGEQYVHLVTGNTPEGIGVEHKSTLNGVSDFDSTNDGTADFELRMVRAGNDFNLFKKAPGTSDWVEVFAYNRPDLPTTLQVGLNIYTAASGDLADLSMIFENVMITQ